MKAYIMISIIITTIFVFTACSSSNVEFSENVLRNQIGTLKWQGSPAVDGVGMLFVVGNTEYGAPGEPDDYSKYLNEGDYEVMIKADIKLTGEKTVRGWGATFPEIEFIRIEKY